MHIFIIITVVLVLALVFWPSYWVKNVLTKYQEPDDLFPGTGGELAVHLLDKLNINDVSVEETEPGQDHYDPVAKVVRLSPDNFNRKSLTAITVAAHENTCHENTCQSAIVSNIREYCALAPNYMAPNYRIA